MIFLISKKGHLTVFTARCPIKKQTIFVTCLVFSFSKNMLLYLFLLFDFYEMITISVFLLFIIFFVEISTDKIIQFPNATLYFYMQKQVISSCIYYIVFYDLHMLVLFLSLHKIHLLSRLSINKMCFYSFSLTIKKEI